MRTLFRRSIWPYPALYRVANRLYRPEQLPLNKADIVIDGFPRSGNWFSYSAFVLSQANSLRICHHHHSPTVILEGARLSKPTLLLIREPGAALISAMVARPDRPLSELLDFYLDYYAILKPHRQKVIVAPFEQVIQNFGMVITQLNHRYGTEFAEFRHTVENVNECFRWLAEAQRSTNRNLPNGIVGHPLPGREPLRREANAKLERALHSAGGCGPRFAAAERSYLSFVETAATQGLGNL